MTILQQKIRSSKYSMTEIAYALGVSEMTLYRKASGKSKIRRGEMNMLSQMLGLTKNEQNEIQKELKDA